MLDDYNNQPFTVSTDGDAGPYLMVKPAQVVAVQMAFSKHRISHAIDYDATQNGGTGVLTVFNFGHSADVTRIERILLEE